MYESRYESVAAITSLPSPNLTRMPVSTGLPVTYVVDRKGVVRHLFNGVVTGPDLDKVLNPLLAEQG